MSTMEQKVFGFIMVACAHRTCVVQLDPYPFIVELPPKLYSTALGCLGAAATASSSPRPSILQEWNAGVVFLLHMSGVSEAAED